MRRGMATGSAGFRRLECAGMAAQPMPDRSRAATLKNASSKKPATRSRYRAYLVKLARPAVT